jgi:hypothetical protein
MKQEQQWWNKEKYAPETDELPCLAQRSKKEIEKRKGEQPNQDPCVCQCRSEDAQRNHPS